MIDQVGLLLASQPVHVHISSSDNNIKVASLSSSIKIKYSRHPSEYYNNSVSSFNVPNQVILAGDLELNLGPSQESSSRLFNFNSPASNSNLDNSGMTRLSSNNVSIVLFNAQSIVNKLLLFQTELLVNKYDLVFITESWLDSTICDRELIPYSYYCVFRKDRH
jgi:hypothetical protein